MMMRRIFAITGRDFKSSLRDFITAWVFIFPPILALVARLWVPAVSAATVRLVTTPDLGDGVIGRLGEYAVVEVVQDRRALDARVLGLDASIGITREGDGYRIVLEGNEAAETVALPAAILADVVSPHVVEIRSVDLGRTGSPIHNFLAILYSLMSLVMAGSLISLSIIEDKETGSLHALTVSPLSRLEYLAGKGILGLAAALVIVFSILYMMGAGPFDPVKVLAVTLAGFVTALIVGFYVGAISDTQITGIAGLKTSNLAFMVVPLVSLVLPEKLKFVLYPVPTYWTYLAYRAVLTEGAPWLEVLRLSGINVALSLALVAVSMKFLNRRLLSRG